MRKSVHHQFADIMANAEDIAALAMEGQGRDATPEMHRILVAHLRSGLEAVDRKLTAITAILDRSAR